MFYYSYCDRNGKRNNPGDDVASNKKHHAASAAGRGGCGGAGAAGARAAHGTSAGAGACATDAQWYACHTCRAAILYFTTKLETSAAGRMQTADRKTTWAEAAETAEV